MFNHILVPLSLSPNDLPAVDAVVELLAGNEGGSSSSRRKPRLARGQGKTVVTLLHVVEPLHDTPYEQISDFYRDIENAALEKMIPISARLAERITSVEREIVYGDRAGKILDFIDERGISLVVLRSHQLERATTRNKLGTISQKVALFAHCPVLLIR